MLWRYFTSPLTAARCIEQFIVAVTVTAFVYLFTKLFLGHFRKVEK